MTTKECNEIYFTRCLLSRAIHIAWEDALNFKIYKKSYTQEEVDRNREEARKWFNSDEFKIWCGALGIDDESILELLIRKYGMLEMQRANKSSVLSECGREEVQEEEMFEVWKQVCDEGDCCGVSPGELREGKEDGEEKNY